MAKGSVRKSRKAEPDAPGVTPDPGTVATAGAAADARREAKPKAVRKVRKQLRRLERQLAAAARSEARRVRRLEKARWRRQRLESVIDQVRATSTVAAGKPVKPAAKAAAKQPSKGKAAAPASPKTAAVAPAAPPKAAAKAPAKSDQPPEAYCLREKKRVQMLDPKPVVTANGGSALSGTCPSCGAALYKLVSRTAR